MKRVIVYLVGILLSCPLPAQILGDGPNVASVGVDLATKLRRAELHYQFFSYKSSVDLYHQVIEKKGANDTLRNRYPLNTHGGDCAQVSFWFWVEGDWDDIPERGINYVNSVKNQITPEQEQKAIAAYYASVSYMDAQVGKVLNTLKEEGLEDKTIVIFTSDHGFHLGEHRCWMNVSWHEESVRVPLIIKMPGKKPTSRPGQNFCPAVDFMNGENTARRWC